MAGGIDQGWFGVADGGGGQLLGAGRQGLGMGGRDGSLTQRRSRLGQGAAEQRPGRPHRRRRRAGRHPQPGPEPAGGGAELNAGFGPGGPAGIHGGQVLEPDPVQAGGQGPELEGLVGHGGVGEPVQVLGVEAV